MTSTTTKTSKLLVIDPATHALRDTTIAELPQFLGAGDVVVVNDAATFPARLWASRASGERVELRLIDAPLSAVSRAVVFGAGSYRERTEDRTAPGLISVGETLDLGMARTQVARVSTISSRLVWLRWLSPLPDVWRAIYALGRPVQYSYTPETLPLYDVQTVFAARPWSAEMPSAARPLTFAMLSALRERGVHLLSLTHAAGLSATGDAALDRALPLPERYEIPEATARAVEGAAHEGRRVLAVGTTVVRALESSVKDHGYVRAGKGLARLVLTQDTPLRRVTGILSGAHTPEESHYRLLQAFVDTNTLALASAHASQAGYRLHEQGDSWLIWPSRERAGNVLGKLEHAY